MKTLALLAALLLLAFQAQAEPLPETDEEAPDQEQPGEEDQEVAISFAGNEGSALRNAGSRKLLTCRCRSIACIFGERITGTCLKGTQRYIFCCR